MTFLLLVSLLALGVGTALLLDGAAWFGRRPLGARIRPYAPPSSSGAPTDRPGSVAGAVLAPVLDALGNRLAQIGGQGEELAGRLARAAEPVSPAAFRLRQVRHAAAGAAAGGIFATVTGAGGLAAISLVVSPALAWVLTDEQSLHRRAEQRSERIRLELPVISEQLGILIAAGYSLPTSLSRLSRRGRGIVAEDLAEVSRRIRQGVGEREALIEWAQRTDLPAVRRLVGILCLHREAGDLGRLITEEARAIRAESHRALVESIERRGQMVWVPVTVATLVPGLLFLAVPFVSAISQVTGT